MSTATPFNSGKGNGFPFCLVYATTSEIASANGEDIFESDVLRFETVTLNEAMAFIWNLESVGFPSVSYGGNTYNFDNADYAYGAPSDGAANATLYPNPKDRACISSMKLRVSSSPRSGSNYGVAQARDNSEQPSFYIRFSVWGIVFNTNSETYNLAYSGGFYADDGVTLLQEKTFSNFTYNYYTY